MAGRPYKNETHIEGIRRGDCFCRRTTIGVTIRLLEAFQAIAITTRSAQQRQAIRQHVEMIHRAGQAAATEKRDSDDLEKRFREVMRQLAAFD